MGCHPSHWRTPSFFRGVGWDHQPDITGDTFSTPFLQDWWRWWKEPAIKAAIKPGVQLLGGSKRPDDHILPEFSLWVWKPVCALEHGPFIVMIYDDSHIKKHGGFSILWHTVEIHHQRVFRSPVFERYLFYPVFWVRIFILWWVWWLWSSAEGWISNLFFGRSFCISVATPGYHPQKTIRLQQSSRLFEESPPATDRVEVIFQCRSSQNKGPARTPWGFSRFSRMNVISTICMIFFNLVLHKL